jgi:hypothetical protein
MSLLFGPCGLFSALSNVGDEGVVVVEGGRGEQWRQLKVVLVVNVKGGG